MSMTEEQGAYVPVEPVQVDPMAGVTPSKPKMGIGTPTMPAPPRGSDVRVILKAALGHIEDRAAERDVKTERSMKKCVLAFNAMFDKDLTEEEGWRFMELLKMSRSTTSDNPDHYEDGAAYAGFAGEAAYQAACRGQKKKG